MASAKKGAGKGLYGFKMWFSEDEKDEGYVVKLRNELHNRYNRKEGQKADAKSVSEYIKEKKDLEAQLKNMSKEKIGSLYDVAKMGVETRINQLEGTIKRMLQKKKEKKENPSPDVDNRDKAWMTDAIKKCDELMEVVRKAAKNEPTWVTNKLKDR